MSENLVSIIKVIYIPIIHTVLTRITTKTYAPSAAVWWRWLLVVVRSELCLHTLPLAFLSLLVTPQNGHRRRMLISLRVYSHTYAYAHMYICMDVCTFACVCIEGWFWIFSSRKSSLLQLIIAIFPLLGGHKHALYAEI